jgi:hypothetical protein
MRDAGSFGAESALQLSAVDEEWGGGDYLYYSHSTIEGKQRRPHIKGRMKVRQITACGSDGSEKNKRTGRNRNYKSQIASAG